VLVALAALVTLNGCSHRTPHGVRTPDSNREIVRVEEDLSAVPVGTVVHLCIRDLPCMTDTTRTRSRSDSQSIDLRLPAGVSEKDANGWPLRAYASAQDGQYLATTRIVYHTSIDPPCKCAGDYAYVKLARQRPRH
jgi:3D (Asp-Asp-Asp) domain-containing protein